MSVVNFSNFPVSRKKRKRVGRGIGSTKGKTCGRGHKGQRSRAGASRSGIFEGGQTALYRRLPMRGFNNIFKKEFVLLDFKKIFAHKILSTLSEIDKNILKECGIISSITVKVKLLGNGDISKPINITVDKASKIAGEKLKVAGGILNVIG